MDCRTSLAEQDFHPGVILGSALVLSTSRLFLLSSPAQAYVLPQQKKKQKGRCAGAEMEVILMEIHRS